jgi:hypothetical protein
MPLKNGWTAGDYAWFRAAFGAYLIVHFAMLFPWGPEVWSSAGAVPDATARPLLYLFPNLLALNDSPLTVNLMLGTAIALSALFAAGIRDRIAAIAIAYIWACLFGRNPLIANPSLPFVGWMLLAHACLPPLGRDWKMPEWIFGSAWAVMAAGYTYSGYTKLVSISWIDGTALARVLSNPLARPGFARDFLTTLPAPALQSAAWGALAFETLFLPLAFFARLRPLIWAAMLGMHLSLMALIDFADLSFGMVMLHAFTFDPSWIRGRRQAAS